MSNGLGLMIEGLVAILLVLTIAYCILLNTRLKRLKRRSPREGDSSTASSATIDSPHEGVTSEGGKRSSGRPARALNVRVALARYKPDSSGILPPSSQGLHGPSALPDRRFLSEWVRLFRSVEPPVSHG